MNIEVKTAELIGSALRYAVAVACGWKLQRIEDGNWGGGGDGLAAPLGITGTNRR